jgi:hypothetical protein
MKKWYVAGFSFVEVITVAGILGFIATLGVRLQQNQTKGLRTSEINSEINNFYFDFSNIIIDGSSCAQTLYGVTTAIPPAGVQINNIIKVRPGSNGDGPGGGPPYTDPNDLFTAYTIGETYAQGRIRIEDMRLMVDVRGQTYFELQVRRLGVANGFFGTDIKTLRLNIDVQDQINNTTFSPNPCRSR